MISLKESWQEQRKLRQQELLQRQEEVRQTLGTFQQERQAKAAALREGLRLFQIGLQLDTQDFLTQTNTQRLIQAEQIAEQLRNFSQTLREQSAYLLMMNTNDRMQMSQQLFEELGKFHTNLSQSVRLLRQELQQRMQQIQADVQQIKMQTQMQLQVHHQERLQNQIQLMQGLENWMESLQRSMQSYLSELAAMRQDRAQQLQTMFQQEHDRRMTDMESLFQELTEFRAELRTFCKKLHQTVWG